MTTLGDMECAVQAFELKRLCYQYTLAISQQFTDDYVLRHKLVTTTQECIAELRRDSRRVIRQPEDVTITSSNLLVTATCNTIRAIQLDTVNIFNSICTEIMKSYQEDRILVTGYLDEVSTCVESYLARRITQYVDS